MIRSYSAGLWVLAIVLVFQVMSAQVARADSKPVACPGVSHATPTLNTLPDGQGYQLQPLIADVFSDPTGQVQASTIARQPFLPGPCNGVFQAPLPNQAVWLRFQAANNTTDDRQWVVGFLEFIFDDVELFAQQGDSVVSLSRGGRTIPVTEKANRAAKTGLSLNVAPGKTRSYYLRVSGTFAPTMTAVIMSPDMFLGWSTLSLTLTAVFLGYVATIALLSVALFRHVDARFYKYYALYMLCFFSFSFIYDGWLSKFIGVTQPVTVLMPIAEFVAGLGVFANIQYCRVLLNIDEDAPVWRRLFALLSGVAVIATCLAVIDPWRLSLPLHLAFFGSPLVLLVVALKKIADGLPQAKPVSGSLLALTGGLFTAVYGFIFPADIAKAASVYDVLLATPLKWGYYLAILGETTFMMIAISTMLKNIQAQKHTALAEIRDLQLNVSAVAKQKADISKTASERIERLEATLVMDPRRDLLAPMEQRFLEQATDCVLRHIADEKFGARELASQLGTSEKTLGRRLKQLQNRSPAAFIRSIRLNHSRELILLRQRNSVAEVAHAAGFTSVSHFAKLYRQQFNETPSQSFKLLKTGCDFPEPNP
ncbi:helix-turn-helix domain-containing protein [Anderseniella sp. Alg231-50]|uniref:helix-turn-helix domain-containing protein n=1 Tax=Anderseniella sp. Alg231-50 TaxID=1922226 RepID=UPI00307C1DEB